MPVLRGMICKPVDIVYLDPLFNAKHNYVTFIESKTTRVTLDDTWMLVGVAWRGEIHMLNYVLCSILDKTNRMGNNFPNACLLCMIVSMSEMRRALKNTGNQHCSPVTLRNLKALMDLIFRNGNFHNKADWQRNLTHNDDRRHDWFTIIVLFYSQLNSYVCNVASMQYDEKYPDQVYRCPNGLQIPVQLLNVNILIIRFLKGMGKNK